MKRLIVLSMFITALVVLTGCTSEAVQTPTETARIDQPATQSLEDASSVQGTTSHRWSETTPTAELEEVTPKPTATIAPTPIPTETSEIVASSTDQCLACHMDQEKLMETAAPEEQAPSESSGVG